MGFEARQSKTDRISATLHLRSLWLLALSSFAPANCTTCQRLRVRLGTCASRGFCATALRYRSPLHECHAAFIAVKVACRRLFSAVSVCREGVCYVPRSDGVHGQLGGFSPPSIRTHAAAKQIGSQSEGQTRNRRITMCSVWCCAHSVSRLSRPTPMNNNCSVRSTP